MGLGINTITNTQNEAGLATVMGHQIAHAIAQHAAERYSEMTLGQAGGEILGASITPVQK
jgi:predicted Zn-dependent protease